MKSKKWLLTGGGIIIVFILLLSCLFLMYWQVSNLFSSLPAGIAGQFGISGLDIPDNALTLREVVNDIDKVKNTQVLFVVSTKPEFDVSEKTVELMVQLKETSPKMVYLDDIRKAGEIVDCTQEQQDDSNILICRGVTGGLSTENIAVISGFSTPDHFESVLTFNLRWVQVGQTIDVECGAAEGFYVSEETNKVKCKEWNKEVAEYERAEKDEYESMITTISRLVDEGNLVVVSLTAQIHKAQIEMLLENESNLDDLNHLILDAREYNRGF